MTSNANGIYKSSLPARLSFRSLYKMYKKLYDENKMTRNGAAYQRMMNFKSKII